MSDATDERRGWRVGHQGRDRMYYEELRDGAWERLDLDGEMLMGVAHHVVYFASPERWQLHPPWARSRRDEIIARIKSEFRAPDYEYHGDTAGVASPTPTTDDTPPHPPPPTPPGAGAARAAPLPQGMVALVVAVVLLLVLAGWMAWLVTDGVVRGETIYLARRAFLRRPVSRLQEPAMFWLCIGVLSAVGAGALTLAVLGIREGRRIVRGDDPFRGGRRG